MTSQPTATHCVIIVATLSILLSALILRPAEPGESLRLAGNPLPDVCLLKQMSGLPCPGCGLTRSLVAAVHADWGKSFIHHRMGLLVLAYLMLQTLARLAWLGLRRLRASVAATCRVLDLGLVPLLVLLFLNWIPTLVGVFQRA